MPIGSVYYMASSVISNDTKSAIVMANGTISHLSHKILPKEDSVLFSDSHSPCWDRVIFSSSADDARLIDHDIESEPALTCSSDTRIAHQSTTVLPHRSLTSPRGQVAIPTYTQLNFINNIPEDVPILVNASAYTDPISTNHETTVSSSYSHRDGIIPATHRPRAPTQIFSSPQELVAHYGIPPTLPPPPNTAPRRTQLSVTQQSPFPDFISLRSNYLNMLSQKSTDNMISSATTYLSSLENPVVPFSDDGLTIDFANNLVDAFKASSTPFDPMEFMHFDDCMLTSNEDSPLSDFLPTPLEDGISAEMMTSPLLYDSSTMVLFADMPADPTPVVVDKEPPFQPHQDCLYTMPPSTPLVDTLVLKPTSLHQSPYPADDISSFPSPAPTSHSSLPLRKGSATGTRKGLKVESLLPVDAPTQPRKYILPSATSKKEVPAASSKKRARSQAFGEEDDLEELQPLAPDATELERIEHKRRQNTIAARKSRIRKLKHQQDLENEVEKLRRDKDRWRTCALMLASTLRANNIPFEFGALDMPQD